MTLKHYSISEENKCNCCISQKEQLNLSQDILDKRDKH